MWGGVDVLARIHTSVVLNFVPSAWRGLNSICVLLPIFKEIIVRYFEPRGVGMGDGCECGCGCWGDKLVHLYFSKSDQPTDGYTKTCHSPSPLHFYAGLIKYWDADRSAIAYLLGLVATIPGPNLSPNPN